MRVIVHILNGVKMSDLIDRQILIEDLREYKVSSISADESEIKGYNDGIDLAIAVISKFPYAERKVIAKDNNVPTKIIHCKDCKWWEKDDDNPNGYCHAIKHGLLTANWDISIRRKYKAAFFCADAEMKEDDDE